MENKIVVVGVIMEDHNGRIALQLRDDSPEVVNAGKWSIFGGKVEQGEKAEQAALREMHEELTVELLPEKLIYLGEYFLPDTEFHIFYYSVDKELDDAILNEGQAWRWCTPDEIRSSNIEGAQVIGYQSDFLEKIWNNKGFDID
jgi:8-oxo-dGTP diphosphatase